MTTRRIADKLPAIAVVDGVHELYDVIVADSPEYLWAAMHEALRRRRERAQSSVQAGPVDFATAMRRVEDEVYDTV
ncbi:MAG: hypothetical protein ACREGK_13780 [Geminicoccales bacterium]